MKAERKTESTCRMPAEISVAPTGFATECPGCVQMNVGPLAPAHLSESHVHQHSGRTAGACRSASKTVDLLEMAEPAPIWMAALLAAPCQAVTNGADHAVSWNYVAGRALYTNSSAEAEFIQPLGVHLQCGDTLAVSWMPGETAYTLEILNQRTHYLA